MTRVIIPGFGKTSDMHSEYVDRLYQLVAKLDRPAIDLSNPDQLSDADLERAIDDLLAEPDVHYADPSPAIGLANSYGDFTREFELATAQAQAAAEAAARPLPKRSEDRVAELVGRLEQGAYSANHRARHLVRHGAAGSLHEAHDQLRVRGLANPGGVTGAPTCGPADDLGYCSERFHRVAARPRLPLTRTWRRILRRVAGRRVSRLLIPRRRVLRLLRVGLPLLGPGLAARRLVIGHLGSSSPIWWLSDA